MNETVKYIFGSLYKAELSIEKINRILRRQVKTNKLVVIFAILTVFNLTLVELRNMAQDEEIKKLTKEIEELKKVNSENEESEERKDM